MSSVGFVGPLEPGAPAVGSPNVVHPVIGGSHQLPVEFIAATS